MRRLPLASMLCFVLLGATAATAQPAAPPLDRAPPLPLDSPAAPLAAPVTVARSGWGPFRSICVDRRVLARPDGGEAPTAPTRCLRVEDARPDPAAAGWRLRLVFDSARTPQGIAFTALRTDDGRIAELDLAPLPPGTPEPTPQQREALLANLRAALTAMGIPRQPLAQGGRFAVPLPGEIAGADLPLDRATLTCAVEGASRIAGRPVLVALCEGLVEAALTARTRGSFRLAGRFAVDVETGLLSAQGYATLTELTLTDPAGGAPRPAGTVLLLARLRME